MRRMLTEKDVDKIDSIDPSDIETLKATGSPKGASSGYVLTADGNGKATYKAVPKSQTSFYSSYNSLESPVYKTDERGNKYLYVRINKYETLLNGYLRDSLHAGDTIIPIAELTMMIWRDKTNQVGDQFRIYLSDEIIAKYSITNTTQFSCDVGYIYVNGR